jgi:Protein of unknown function (DUF3224)
VTQCASGTFEVTITPVEPAGRAADASINRMFIDKVFEGELEARSIVLMLAVSTETEGSAAYVAMERVTGKLHGRSGTFALQHSGTMTRGAPELLVNVVPDSGTDELAGLTGRMAIDIVDGKHLYEFTYSLPFHR